MSILKDREIEAAKGGTFSVDCLTMELRSRGEGPGRAFRGPGVIRQDGLGALQFTLYDASYEFGPSDLEATFSPPGDWLPEESFYDLSATDWTGRNWQAEWIQPDTSTRMGQPGVVVRGVLRGMTATSDDTATGCIESLHFLTGDRIPTNKVTETITTAAGRTTKRGARNVWLFQAGPYELLFTKTESVLQVDAKSKADAFPDGFDSRIEEALWFLLANPLEWTILEVVTPNGSRACIRPTGGVTKRPRLRPPIEPHQIDAVEDTERLLSQYLLFVHDYDGARYHPLSVNIRKVLRASTGTIQEEALQLSVSVEWIVRRYFSGYGEPSKTVLATIDRFNALMASWEAPSELKDRLLGCAGSIKGTNPRTALRRLAEQGAITTTQFEAWERLRHPAAHGLESDENIRDLVTLCDKVHQLLLLLTFGAIGYKGFYTDHCARGWPLVTFAGPEAAA